MTSTDGSERDGSEQGSDRPDRPGIRLERGWLALLVLAGLGLRLVDLPRPFDRQFDGFQAAFFALAAIDYERLEPDRETLLPRGAGAGYPVVNLELEPDRPDTWYVYANHPPLVPLLAWGALAAGGPDGWSEAWREARPPSGVEGPLRAPFLALHLGAALLFWAALRRAGAPRAAGYALALFAWLPSSLLYAGLVNYEQPSLFAVGLGALGAAGYAARGGARHLALVALGFAAGGAVTYAPLVTAAVIGFVALDRGPRRALLVATTAVAAGVATLGLHAASAARTLLRRGEDPGALSDRVDILLGPLLDGSLPLTRWLAVQAELARAQVGLVALGLALLGAGLALVRQRRAGAPRRAAGLVLALLAGGAGVQLAFYRHTGDPQDPFLIHLLPGLAGAAGLFLAAVARRSPALALALLTLAVGEGAWRAEALHRRWRARPTAAAPATRLPRPIELGATVAELVPPGGVVWVPASLGLGPSTGYYAWRTLLPVAAGAYEASQVMQNDLGLEQAPTWLVVPAEVPEPLRERIGAVLLDLEGVRPGALAAPDAEADGWRAWRLR